MELIVTFEVAAVADVDVATTIENDNAEIAATARRASLPTMPPLKNADASLVR
jgi:hypothetical protein